MFTGLKMYCEVLLSNYVKFLYDTLYKKLFLCHVQKPGCCIFSFNYICSHDKHSHVIS